eukprot:NODE_2205_length_626_cov_72.488978_g2155_i0.p1 GENE.NODE_2205_length_626_cov_72.488978_g2155_i0~~NODE_2205_length_626_cov_72.488978_g2155_i0.p1  ORF type:complete len:161 (-),score=32.67 NODE_2205_length_626_cov_72.488978_g2155_i0:37-519(-)
MPHSFGIRARTRHLFSTPFRKHGPIHLSTYLKVYKVGDIVDIKADAKVQKGMPHKYYHGKTGVVYNVTPHAVGIIVTKTVGNRIINKRINVRIEHVKHSKCRDDFLNRVKKNEELRKKAKESGKYINLKRQPPQPRDAHHISTKRSDIDTVYPVPYELIV